MYKYNYIDAYYTKFSITYIIIKYVSIVYTLAQLKEKTTKFLENLLGFLGNRLSFNDTSKLTEVNKYLDYFII